MIVYDYSDLIRKIIDTYGSIESFAVAMGMEPRYLRRKLNNKSEWTQEEMIAAAELLCIRAAEIEKYFFSHDSLEN